MKTWLKLCRWPNLLMVGLAQILFKYVFLPAFKVPSVLSLFDFSLLCFSIILVTASGNIINDIYDIDTDFVNQRPRPLAQNKISITKAYIAYVFFNILSILSVLYLSVKIEDYTLILIVLGAILMLFLYAKYLKAVPLTGNVLVSFLVSLSFLLVVYVEFRLTKNFQMSTEIKYWLIGYGGFAFWANLNREWIKDVLDLKGDYAQGISTLPILLGRHRMNRLIFASTLFLMFALIAGVKIYVQPHLFFVLYLTFGIFVPLFYVLFHIYKQELKVNYNMLSRLYKIVMLIGVLSLILFQL